MGRPPTNSSDYPSDASRGAFLELMREKVRTSEALFQDLLDGDPDGVARKATRLREISLEAERQRTPTPEHARFAEQFRQALDQVIGDAEAGDGPAVFRSYGAVSTACLECHAFLRNTSDYWASARGSFDGQGYWEVAGGVPPVLAELSMGFRSAGYARSGKAALSNRAPLVLE